MTSFRSILDKPLQQLTEEDISQLTREDCRNFLKDKGMRRPSWNKSQAIQQVISLKALLEGSEDDSAGATTLKKIVNLHDQNNSQVNSISDDLVKESQIAVVNVSDAEDMGACQEKDAPEAAVCGEVASSPIETDKRAISPRCVVAADDGDEQMTIFYCGKVNVYDGVSPDKARTIMQLAASPFNLPHEDSAKGGAALWSYPSHVQYASDRVAPLAPSAMLSQGVQTERMSEFSQQYVGKSNGTRDHDVEGQLNRKVSVQRYLEKRNHRGRFKPKKDSGPVSSTLGVYWNHQLRPPISSGPIGRGTNNVPMQPGLTNGAGAPGLAHITKIASLPIDLNDKDA